MHNCHGSQPQGCFCFNYVSPPKNRARSPQQSKPDYSFLAGEKGGESRGIKVRNFKEQRAHMKQRCSSEAFPGGRHGRAAPKAARKHLFPDMEKHMDHHSSRNNGCDKQRVQTAEKSMHQGRSSNPPLLVSLRG